MTDVAYLVIKRSGIWWVLFEGARGGPFQSEDAAIAAAVSAAKIGQVTGVHASVEVDRQNEGVATVFSTKTDGMPN